MTETHQLLHFAARRKTAGPICIVMQHAFGDKLHDALGHLGPSGTIEVDCPLGLDPARQRRKTGTYGFDFLLDVHRAIMLPSTYFLDPIFFSQLAA